MFSRTPWVIIGAVAIVVSSIAMSALADRITLKDGTVLEGVAMKVGDKYWIKSADGSTRTVPATDVASVGSAGAPATPATGAGKEPAAAGADPAPAPVSGTPVELTQRRVQNASTAMAAVAIWQKFIDDNPKDTTGLATAKVEMAKWQKLADDKAERINGKWVGGAERKAILEKAAKLTAEGYELMEKNQTIQAIKKLEEANRVYPNSFRANFALGYLMVLSNKNPEAIRFMENALRQNPKSPETLNNMGVAYMRQRQYVDGISCLSKAAEYGDSAPLCQNLINGIASIPQVARATPKIQPAIESATLLASKYGINGPSGTLTIVGLRQGSEHGKEGSDEAPHGMSSGTGFLINNEGLILTNRHVVKGAKTLLVLMNDHKQVSAEVVTIDEEQDLALVKIKLTDGAKTPFVHLCVPDNPGDGAECTVMGFPLIDRLGAAIKITRGIVSSGSAREEGADIVTDAKVNPGNSGGPMLDRNGFVMGIVTMKSANSRFEDSYGMAISAGKVRKFLAKNTVTVTPGVAVGAGMTAEEIATKVKPATVCIICTEREREK
jgi:S1-C subfamily serine protease